ncbi:TetR/AcrR family transcriptional regulator [Streptomyces sp. TS71-3]|uniref:TetR/AcrR family transcriptional regulator n=1 Tax=Streptomyces sp. TS71-3 TaxID=2733862 RepID=UPI001BB3DA4B|nr:TetR/AcrR family transcriptional regulator [Streptomyces sp. TS71-3]
MTNQPAVGETARPARRDVQRNLDALLSAAAVVFAAEGVDAPVRRITAEAGVGTGTLYRHFPERSDLIVAVFRREVDTCTAAAAELAAVHEPVEALRLWLERLADFVATKRGLKAALHSGDPAYESLPDYFRERFLPALDTLMAGAALAEPLDPAISAYDLLRAMGSVTAPEDPAYTRRMIRLIVNGLRHPSGT